MMKIRGNKDWHIDCVTFIIIIVIEVLISRGGHGEVCCDATENYRRNKYFSTFIRIRFFKGHTCAIS